MTALPSVLDVEDALERVRTEAGVDVDEEIDAIEERLAAMSGEPTDDWEPTLDEIEETLLRLEERTEGEAERDVRAARNRIGIYRESRGESGDTLFVLNSDAHAIEHVDPDRDEQITATVINTDEARDVRLTVTFYDDDEAVDEVVSPAVRVGADDQQTVEFTPETPRDATSYTVEARDADEYDTVGEAGEEPPAEARSSAATTGPMRLDRAHESLRAAEESASNQVREQLLSIEEGLDELVGGDKTEDGAGPHPDRIEEIEEKLTGLESETDGATQDRIEDARDHLLTYRRDHV